ncbi:MAG: amidohydrolase family protein [Candidatus Marinimicrobia bacterium]|jgi:imidazolonepropionase-like amidohydrolase|nr:amidohydrolase family protein [Candidatus Neomarinimicrobiota bacterium]MDD5709117.1 amidohydrolase family protein [Candidatus Neomarinimicrobiota bacterium]MDX9777877.1 amidohydrolase family protein [bacterium]
MAKTISIHADVLYDGNQLLENKTLIIEKNLIVDIRDQKGKTDYSGIVTPAFIDGHSHIGMHREGEPSEEGETNDVISQLLISNDPLNSIYFDDRAFSEAVDFGQLYSCVVPGSGNLIGGKARIIRNFSPNRKDAVIKDYGYKMALGYNPRSTTDWKGERPNTRMGVYGVLERKFDEILLKKEKAEFRRNKALREADKQLKEAKISATEHSELQKDAETDYRLNFSTEEMDYLDLLSGNKIAKVHVHKEDDVLYLIYLKEKYGLRVTAEHLGDVWHKEIFKELVKHSIPIVYGPLASLGYKVELKHGYYQNVKLLMEACSDFGLMSDHPVILTTSLRDTLKYFLIYGMTETQALGLITRNNARILGIDEHLGTLEPGKWASLLVWDRDPLHLAAFPKLVMGEGEILRKRKA